MAKKISKRQKQYLANKAAKVGEEIICPICGEHFIKKQYSQAFDDTKCKDIYWNAKKDRHTDPDYYRKYNHASPDKVNRIAHAMENCRIIIGEYDPLGGARSSISEIMDHYDHIREISEEY